MTTERQTKLANRNTKKEQKDRAERQTDRNY